MASPKKRVRSRARKKKNSLFPFFRKIALFCLMAAMVGFTVFAAGYVIFFRTVFAQEILPALKNDIVFEEPDPPVHVEVAVDRLSDIKIETPIGEEEDQTQRSLPEVAIIIDDLGYHRQIGEKFLAFPFELTYSFLPLAPFTARQEKFAHDLGKVVLLHLPMEPRGRHWNPGPGTLFLSDSPQMQKETLEQDLAAVPHAVGVNNHMGSLFTTDRASMGVVLSHVKEHGMFFVDSVTVAESIGFTLGQELGLSVARRNVFLDNSRLQSEICLQLGKLIQIAEERGSAIGIAHPHHETHEALKRCVPQYIDRVKFVSVTAIIENY